MLQIGSCENRVLIVKSGKNCNDRHRYQCKHCHKRFITEYIYNAYLPNTDSKITQLSKEGLDTRGTIRVWVL